MTRSFRSAVRISGLVFFLGAAFSGTNAKAQNGDPFDRLSSTPVTLLDAGIKRVRAGARLGARRLTPATGPQAQFRVFFDRELRRLEIRFAVGAAPENLNERYCWARRAVAIRETFSVGATSYALSLSDEERVKRRLGSLFSREPDSTEREKIALGQRLAESTFVELRLSNPASETPVICRAVVYRLDWK
jgi:hypothetical protein